MLRVVEHPGLWRADAIARRPLPILGGLGGVL